jgi:TPR repeat protein
MKVEALFLEADEAFDVIQALVDKGHYSWTTLPLRVKIRMESCLRKYLECERQGYTFAQLNLGVLYSNGQGVQQNFKEAVTWYRKAASQGFAEAWFALGVTYNCGGHGVEQDFEEAAECFRQAANQGLAKAQYNLGNMYCKGHGVEQDFEKATELYQQLAGQGFTDAQFNLSIMQRREN